MCDYNSREVPPFPGVYHVNLKLEARISLNELCVCLNLRHKGDRSALHASGNIPLRSGMLGTASANTNTSKYNICALVGQRLQASQLRHSRQ